MPSYLHQARRRARIEMARLQFRLGRGPATTALDAVEAIRSLPDEPRILFVCQGNICRSPMAERYLRARLAAADVDGVTVDSAGLVAREGRPSPPAAVEVAPEYGVDLSEHEARRITDDDVAASDLVLLMDARNRYFWHAFAGPGRDAYLLGAFGDGRSNGWQAAVEIEDPDQQGAETFAAVYEQIAAAVDELAAVLADSLADARQKRRG